MVLVVVMLVRLLAVEPQVAEVAELLVVVAQVMVVLVELPVVEMLIVEVAEPLVIEYWWWCRWWSYWSWSCWSCKFSRRWP